MPSCERRGQPTNCGQKKIKESDVKSVGVWSDSTRWKQFVPLFRSKDSFTTEFVQIRVMGIESSSQLSRGVVAIKNSPENCCSAVDEKPAELGSICLLHRTGQG